MRRAAGGRPTLRAVAVGVPARDEEPRIGTCVAAVLEAVGRLGVPAAVVVAADACRDATAERAAAALLRADPGVVTAVVRLDPGGARDGCVGAARQAACARAVALLAEPTGAVWLATTDADSVVPPTWLVDQWRWAAAGVDGVAGLVDVDPADGLAPAVRERWLAVVDRGGRGSGHGHVHGANLGIRADVWQRAGGFPPVACAEEHALWRAARRRGARLVGVDDVVVRTSGRLDGRAPGGFAHLLRDLSEPA